MQRLASVYREGVVECCDGCEQPKFIKMSVEEVKRTSLLFAGIQWFDG